MASNPNRSLRRILLARGISRRFIPQTRLAQLAAYSAGIALVFGLLLLGLRGGGGSESAIGFADWWFTATRIVTGILLFALLVRWIRQRFLWSLRRRLFVAYFFIGVIPVALLPHRQSIRRVACQRRRSRGTGRAAHGHQHAFRGSFQPRRAALDGKHSGSARISRTVSERRRGPVARRR